MRGVIVEGELWTAAREGNGGETVRVFLELEDGTLHVRRGYGQRSTVLSVDLGDVEAALAALKYDTVRRAPVPRDDGGEE